MMATRSVPPVRGVPAAGFAAPAWAGVAPLGADTDTLVGAALGAGGVHAAIIETPPSAPNRRNAARRLMSVCSNAGVDGMINLSPLSSRRRGRRDWQVARQPETDSS